MKTRNVKLKNDKYELLEFIRLYYLKKNKKHITKTSLLGLIVEQLYNKIKTQ